MLAPLVLALVMGFNVQVAHAENLRIEFTIKTMQNLTDQYKVRKILSSLEGAVTVILNVGDDVVILTYDDDKNSVFDIKAALAASGYPATNVKSQ